MPHFLEYIWLDKEGIPRSKVRTSWDPMPETLPELSNIPVWNFDASSTGQNIGKDTEAVLKPVRLYFSPLDKDYLLVLCQLDLEYDQQSEVLNKPVKGFNTRVWASRVENQYKEQEPWFGLEQEYTFLDSKTNLPINWDQYGGEKQGNYYCSVRYPYCQLNEIVRKHLRLCAEMGVRINGLNAEVMPGQWEFQIGPSGLLKAADDLIMARYILFRLSAQHQVKVTFHPKPMSGDWNGSGCHINFSTRSMRTEGGMDHIEHAIKNLERDHPKILKYYGEYNELRLTGEHETSSAQKFSWGVGTRHTSVRIPNQVVNQGYGYLEDRRPASNIDPYIALAKLLDTSQRSDSEAEPEKQSD